MCMKINQKLGGINHSVRGAPVDWLPRPLRDARYVMLMGADVSHGTGRNEPSVTAVTATIDDTSLTR